MASGKIAYRAHPALLRAAPLQFFFYVLLIPLGGLGLILLIVWHIQNVTKRVTLLDDDIIYEWGLFSKTRSEIKLERVRAVNVHQSFLQRIFHTGNVKIYTSGDRPEIELEGFPAPNDLRRLIREHTPQQRPQAETPEG